MRLNTRYRAIARHRDCEVCQKPHEPGQVMTNEVGIDTDGRFRSVYVCAESCDPARVPEFDKPGGVPAGGKVL